MAACAPAPPSAHQTGTPPKHATIAKAKPAPKPNPKPEEAEAPAPEPSELIGRNVSMTRKFLGEPVMVRRERGAALWLYRTGRCNAHILTNATNRGEIVRSLHFRDTKTQRAFDAESKAGKYCFDKMMRAAKAD